jgi:hypothetical protein
MKTQAEFQEYYSQYLKKKVEILEDQQKKNNTIHNFKTYRIVLAMLIAIVVIVVTLIKTDHLPEAFFFVVPLTVLFAIFYPLVVLFKRGSAFLDVNDDYKKNIVSEIVRFINKNFVYKPESGVSEDDIKAFGLFGNFYQFFSEDLIEGKINDINFKLSDIKVYQFKSIKEAQITRMKNKGAEKNISFEGLYAIVSLKQKIETPIHIQFKTLSHKILDIANKPLIEHLKSDNKNLLVKSSNEGFNNYFNVYCNNEELAQSVLTPKLTTCILENTLKMFPQNHEFLKNPLNIMIKENNIYMAFFNASLFEMSAFKSISNENLAMEYFTFISSVIAIGEEINKEVIA